MKDIILIINKPAALSTQNKITSFSLTFVFWLLLFYLWQPFISLLAWNFGFKIFYEHMIILGGYEGFFKLLSTYLIIIGVLGGSLITWAYINKLKFTGKVRRTNMKAVSSVDISIFFQIKKEDHGQWKKQKNLNIAITDDLKITVKTNKTE